MKLPRVRMTVRRWMAAVTVVGVILGCELTRRRHAHYRGMAAYHANEERRMRALLLGGIVHGPVVKGRRQSLLIGPGLEREAVERRLLYHAILRDGYERAVRSPWLFVGPDRPWLRVEPDSRFESGSLRATGSGKNQASARKGPGRTRAGRRRVAG